MRRFRLPLDPLDQLAGVVERLQLLRFEQPLVSLVLLERLRPSVHAPLQLDQPMLCFVIERIGGDPDLRGRDCSRRVSSAPSCAEPSPPNVSKRIIKGGHRKHGFGRADG